MYAAFCGSAQHVQPVQMGVVDNEGKSLIATAALAFFFFTSTTSRHHHPRCVNSYAAQSGNKFRMIWEERVAYRKLLFAVAHRVLRVMSRQEVMATVSSNWPPLLARIDYSLLKMLQSKASYFLPKSISEQHRVEEDEIIKSWRVAVSRRLYPWDLI
ncbi:uncharacterized protein BT62DRAFT_1011208 [Guyanagaster necrorhizus]|uniref:Uncharacterized protein n=1 Tax=Guyanagaster necrorhizus TaxID=856835 RepID=A0A9P7VJK3_9AGAR|nr:uncharacterized protein BT62DRAFT_1011208 [Guyanagaster necrorhizus MCA 3950]KAG7441879.1 hypothetical protein BT62DRAFT_1011208 [Guyanagaster necrorhizus MCA 3950]